MVLYENLDSVKGKVAEWGGRFGYRIGSLACECSASTKGEPSHFDVKNWLKYAESFEIPAKECELLGCYNCVYAQFSDAYKGCSCCELRLEEGICITYEAIEPTVKEAVSGKPGDKT